MRRSVFIILLLLLLSMVGCKTHHTISSSHSTEKNHSNDHKHTENTIDSTTIWKLREVIRINDTIYIHDSIYIERWRDRQVVDSIHDTLYINNTDTIRYPVEIEKPIAPFVRNSCIVLWVIIGVAILALIGWIAWNFATGKFSWTSILKWILRR